MMGVKWSEGCACGAHYSISLEADVVVGFDEPFVLTAWRERHKTVCYRMNPRAREERVTGRTWRADEDIPVPAGSGV